MLRFTVRSTGRVILPLLMALAVIAPVKTGAQEVIAQYYETLPIYNPAAAGASGLLDIRGGARLDRGFGNLYLLSADAPLPVASGRFGMGLTGFYDDADPLRTAAGALRLSVSEKMFGGRLHGGFSVGYLRRNYNYPMPVADNSDSADITDNSDISDDSYSPALSDDPTIVKLKASAVDIGGGLFFVHPRFWAGISLLHANAPELDFGTLPTTSSGPSDSSDSSDASDSSDSPSSTPSHESIKQKIPRTVHAMLGTTLRLSSKFELLPSAMLTSGGGSTWVDLTGRVRYRRIFTLGAAWRNARTASLLASINYKGLFVGYAYGYPLSAARRAQSHGVHEIMAGYSLRIATDRKPGTRHKSIRLM